MWKNDVGWSQSPPERYTNEDISILKVELVMKVSTTRRYTASCKWREKLTFVVCSFVGFFLFVFDNFEKLTNANEKLPSAVCGDRLDIDFSRA